LPVKSRSANEAPRVAVIVPAFGVAHLISGALDSLLAQDFDNWEAVVIDDGAPDDVAGAVLPYLADGRIAFLATENRGVSAARNHAIAHTKAPLITLLDGDDQLRPNYLSSMIAALDADPDAVLATCDALIFGSGPAVGHCVCDKFNQTPRGTLAQVMDRSFNVYIGTTFRRAAFERVGGFDEAMKMAEDLDLWVRLLIDGGHALFIDQVLGEYCSRPQSASTNYRPMLEGEYRVHVKAQAALGTRPEGALAQQAAARIARQIRREKGIESILAGDAHAGLQQMREASPDDQSLTWKIALSLWALAPFTARPILRYRQRLYSNIRG
jgi:Glycosyl transferase family 2